MTTRPLTSLNERRSARAELRAAVSRLPADTPVILRFDETLWLRDSTEMYLRSLWPRLPAVLLLMLLERLRPWRYLAGAEAERQYRDCLRVLVTSLLLPWNIVIWRRRARRLGPVHANEPLLALTGKGAPPLVVSSGFRFIVAPLLRAIDPRLRLCVAGGFWTGFRLRRRAKWPALVAAVGAPAASRALYVTNSDDDRDVLDAVEHPLLIRWPAARHVDALADAYVPFLYTQRGKRTGSDYLVQVVLKRDVAVLWLAYAWSQPSPVLAGVALLLLHLSFWLIYEISYHENDVLGERLESQPSLAAGFGDMRQRMCARCAWIASLLLALPALPLLACAADAQGRGALTAGALIGLALGWVLYLAAARATFWLYNHRSPASRGLLYLGLQLFRSVGYGLFLPATVAGAALCIAHVLVSWVPYLAYRYGHVRIETPDRLLYPIDFLLVLLAVTLLTRDPGGLLNVQTGAILLYFGWRARHEAMAWLRSATPLAATSGAEPAPSDRAPASPRVRDGG